MTIPTSGSFTDATCRTEWTLGLPMTSAQLGAAAGLGSAFTSEQLRGLSAAPAVTVTINGTLSAQNIGGNNRQSSGFFTVTVTGGTPTSYVWSDDAADVSNSTPTSSSTTFTGPTYQTLTEVNTGSVNITCAVVVGGVTYYGTATRTYTYP